MTNPFTITVEHNNQTYNYTIVPIEDKDQVLYEVHDRELFCIVGLDNEGEWSVDRDIPLDFINQIGNAIDEHEGG